MLILIRFQFLLFQSNRCFKCFDSIFDDIKSIRFNFFFASPRWKLLSRETETICLFLNYATRERKKCCIIFESRSCADFISGQKKKIVLYDGRYKCVGHSLIYWIKEFQTDDCDACVFFSIFVVVLASSIKMKNIISQHITNLFFFSLVLLHLYRMYFAWTERENETVVTSLLK